jgi:hypothetical protein
MTRCTNDKVNSYASLKKGTIPYIVKSIVIRPTIKEIKNTPNQTINATNGGNSSFLSCGMQYSPVSRSFFLKLTSASGLFLEGGDIFVYLVSKHKIG